MQKLNAEQVTSTLRAVPSWHEQGGQIQRTYVFKDFIASMAFVQRVAEYAERVQHHPDILIRWNKVTLSVNTHDAGPGGGITEKDFALAKAADSLAG